MRKLTQAVRQLGASPALAAVVLVTLALAIGAGSAVFSVVDAVLLRPLRYPDAHELVLVKNRLGERTVPLSAAELFDVRKEAGLFAGAAGANPIPANVTGPEGDERVNAIGVTVDYFDVLGSRAVVGRTFDARDDRLGYGETAVLSYAYWKRRYGGDPRILGAKLRLDEDDYTIVGVMGPEFHHPTDPSAPPIDVFLPCGFRHAAGTSAERDTLHWRMLQVIARLAPGVTVAHAQERLDTYAARMRAEHPKEYGALSGAAVQPLAEEVVASARRTLLVLVAAVGAVLLMACANVATLLLARGDGRRRETAIRAALGATRARIALDVLVESVLLALGGGALGLLVALWGKDLLVALAPPGMPRTDEVAINGRVLAFTFAVSVATGVLFGVLPSLQATRVEPHEVMKEGGRATYDRRRARVLRALVTVELAVSVVLLVSTGVRVRELRATLATDPGFEAAGLAVARMWVSVPNEPQRSPYADAAKRADLGARLALAFADLRGVRQIAVASHVPVVDGRMRAKEGCVPEGAAPDEAQRDPEAVQHVGPGYFDVMHIRLLAGRPLDARDGPGAPRVLVVSEGLARRWFGGPEAAVGKVVRCHVVEHNADGEKVREHLPYAVVGVVADVRGAGLTQPPSPTAYYPLGQMPDFAFAFLLRRDAGVTLPALTAQLRARARAVEPAYPLVEVADVEQALACTVAPRRFLATVLGFFAAVAFALATMGTYGAASFAVGQRRDEIGLRVALGAPERRIVRMVLAQTVVQALPGVVAGLAVALVIHGPRAVEPMTLGAVVVLLAGAALVASWFPTIRATRATPVLALRGQ